MKIRYLFLAGFLLMAQSAFAQLTIAPTNLFIDSQNKFGTYMVINNSSQPQEVSVDFYFGYMLNDEDGNRVMVKEDEDKENIHSIANSVRAFPQNFILQSGQRQIVRIRIAASNDIEDGTYWARISTTSNKEAQTIEDQAVDGVSANLAIKIEQVTGLFYKKGNIATGIQIDEIKAKSDDDILTVATVFKRLGNSPFLGTITTNLLNSKGEIVREHKSSTSLYFDGTHKANMDISDIDKGNYTVRVLFETERSDIASTELIQMEPVTKTISYIVN